MRNRLSTLLREFATTDPNLYVLSGDHGYALFDLLRKTTPEQFINVGVSEQSMVGIAAGLAKTGIRPIVYGLAAFIPIRVLEFIKMDVCYEALPVIFLGDGAGLVYSTLGSSHQCAEDMAVLMPLPNMTIYSPADARELEYCFRRAMADLSGASYIRVGKSDRPAVHTNDEALTVRGGCVEICRSQFGPTVFATGSMVSVACDLAKEIPLTVISVPVPTDLSAGDFNSFSQGSETVVTMEEHSLQGGLGSVIDGLVAATRTKKTIYHFGLQKRFTTIASSYEVAMAEHQLSFDQIRSRFREFS